MPRVSALYMVFFVLYRLLLQLEETLHNFDEFWSRHEQKLQQCLQLRRFEEDFKLVSLIECAWVYPGVKE